MGSPITFSGFNSIDFGAVLNLIMQQERAPISRLETQKTQLRTQNTAYATFATKLGTFQTAVQALSRAGSLGQVAATSSNPSAVGVSTLPGSIEGAYDIVVSELARPQVMSSTTTYASLQDVVAAAGTIRFSGPNGDVDLTITEPVTLQQLAERINALPNRPVTASVVQVSPGSYKLVLTAAAPGVANGFTVSLPDAPSGGAGVLFTDTDGDGTFGNSPEDSVQSATDAALTVNNIAITSSSNVIDGAVPAVTLTLGAKDPNTPVTVTVAKDTEAAVDLVEKMMTAYNDLVTFMEEQSASAANGLPSIARDPLLRGLRDTLRQTVLGAHGAGDLSRLPAAGVGFDRSGRMVLDKDVFATVSSGSPEEVQALFEQAFTALDASIKGYTQSGGLVASARERLDAQVEAIDQRIATLEEQLALRRMALQQEFIAADRAMAQLNSQGNSLLQLGGQYRLF